MLVLLWAGVAGYLYAHNLGAHGFWIDELFTSFSSAGERFPHDRMQTGAWLDSSKPPAAIRPEAPWYAPWVGVVDESMPPLYFQVVHVVRRLLGDGDVTIRSVGVACGLATIPVVFLGTRWCGLTAWAAALAAGVQTLSWVNIYLARDARPYAMANLLSCVAVAVAARASTRPSRRSAVALALAVAAMTATHYFTAAIAAAIFVYGVVLAPAPGARRTIIAGVLVGLRCSPSHVGRCCGFRWRLGTVARRRRGCSTTKGRAMRCGRSHGWRASRCNWSGSRTANRSCSTFSS